MVLKTKRSSSASPSHGRTHDQPPKRLSFREEESGSDSRTKDSTNIVQGVCMGTREVHLELRSHITYLLSHLTYFF